MTNYFYFAENQIHSNFWTLWHSPKGKLFKHIHPYGGDILSSRNVCCALEFDSSTSFQKLHMLTDVFRMQSLGLFVRRVERAQSWFVFSGACIRFIHTDECVKTVREKQHHMIWCLERSMSNCPAAFSRWMCRFLWIWGKVTYTFIQPWVYLLWCGQFALVVGNQPDKKTDGAFGKNTRTNDACKQVCIGVKVCGAEDDKAGETVCSQLEN